MAVEVVGTITVNSDVGTSANSYASIAAYKELLGIDPYKDISLQADEQIAKALLYATSYIDGKIQGDLRGDLFDESYALLFPRTGLKDYRGVEITDYTVFPDQLVKATIYQAWWVTQKDVSAADPALSAVKKKEMEGLGSVEYFSASDQKTANKVQKFAKEVPDLLASFLYSGLSGNIVVMQRG